MKMPTKVVLEITAAGYTTTVYAEDEIISKRTMKMVSPARARSVEVGDIFDDIKDVYLQEFAEEVSDLDGFGVAGELFKLME